MVNKVKTNKQIIQIAAMALILVAIFVIFNITNKDKTVEIFGKKIENLDNKKVYNESDEIYISFDIIKKHIDNDIYYDKISNSLIITRESQILRLKIGSKEAFLNYEKIKNDSSIIKNDNDIYIPISSIKNIYEIVGLSNEFAIYIEKNNSQKVKLKNNNVKIHTSNSINSKAIGSIDKKEDLVLYYNLTGSNWYMVKTKKGKTGYIQRYNLNDDSISKINSNRLFLKEIQDKKAELTVSKKINGITHSDKNEVNKTYIENNISNVFVDMFEVLNINGEINVASINQKWIYNTLNGGYKIYGNITNGYESSNFDNMAISRIINSINIRSNLISNIITNVEKYKLEGVVIDFRNIKDVDAQIYTQFLKELSVSMKNKGKKTIVKAESNKYLDISKSFEYIDYYIIEGFNQRDLDSNISGTDSDINIIKEKINNIAKIQKGKYLNKVLLELPTFSILWTEKNGRVINSQRYNQKEVINYITKNKLSKKTDKKTNQNYIEMTKGVITYKMWLEDEYSIKQKNQLVKSNNLAGVILYKSDYVTNSLIEIVK